jgi:hypothetical protein
MSILNKIISSSIISVALLAGITLAPLGASALAVSTSGNGSVSVGSTNTSDAVSVGVGASASTSASQSFNSDNTSASTSAQKSSAGVGLETNAIGLVVTAPTQVSTSADLQVFSNNVMAENADVASVNADATSTGGVEVSYKHLGHLFGIFPIWVTSTTDVSADASGQTQVSTYLPWWSFLVTGTGNVKSSVDASLSNSSSVAAALSANSSAAARAEVVQAIIDAHAAADASASANADTSAAADTSTSGSY